MFVFDVRKGLLTENNNPLVDGDKVYSGFGSFHNRPECEMLQARGPLPRGKYRIGKAYQHDHLGPMVMNLEPLPGTQMFGRSAMRIHGDNRTPDPWDGSHGCVIASRALREHIDKSQDRILEVI